MGKGRQALPTGTAFTPSGQIQSLGRGIDALLAEQQETNRLLTQLVELEQWRADREYAARND